MTGGCQYPSLNKTKEGTNPAGGAGEERGCSRGGRRGGKEEGGHGVSVTEHCRISPRPPRPGPGRAVLRTGTSPALLPPVRTGAALPACPSPPASCHLPAYLPLPPGPAARQCPPATGPSPHPAGHKAGAPGRVVIKSDALSKCDNPRSSSVMSQPVATLS
ncbi:oleosin-B6-like [Calypte anna]|uniref:oleosin-B6-like n=1 Tax=Calypte anna TaxID=9244 RepID=UPI0011C478F1|nr:oleosin-B6-like [Calypte anna]